ncbi:EamA family transporter [uncultured Friedmanniella sp.]|uniref:EamA family transporter n=1 Tax=uncultured Friedmanniella sp. TaxID=335381 RepID=UPI0035CB0466
MTRSAAGLVTRPSRRAASRPWLPPVALAGVAVVWGVTFTVVDGAVDAVPVVDLVGWRFGLATLLLLLLRRSGPTLPRRLLGRTVLLGLLLGSGFLLQAWALTYTDALVSGFLTGMLVVVAPLAGWLMFRQRPAAGVGAGVVLAVGGVLLLGGPGGGLGPGEWLTLAAAVVWGLHLVLMSRWAEAPYALALARTQTGTVAATAVLAGLLRALVTGSSPLPALPAGASTWCSVGYLSVAATAGALVLLSWSQARVDATRAAVILTLEPAVSGLTAAVTGRALDARVVVGSALLLVAMLLVELGRRPPSPSRRPS